MKRGYLLLVLTFFLWGSLYVMTKYAFAAIPPLTVLLLRYVLALPILGWLAWRKGITKIEKRHWPYVLCCGGLGYALSIGLQLLANNLLDASLASLLNATNPVFISLFAVLLLKERMNRNKIIGIVCSLLGVVVVLGLGGSAKALGLIFCAGAVLFWSLHSVLVRKISAFYSTEQVTFCCMAVALPFCLTASVIELQSQPIAFTPGAVGAVVYIAIMCTAVANLAWNRSLALVDASVCSLFYPLQPLTSAVLGVLLLGEPVTVNFVLGGLLISAGVVIGLREPKKRA